MKTFMPIRSFLVASLVLALAGPAMAQERAKPAMEYPTANVLTAWLDQANIHPSVTVGSLTFFPLSAEEADKVDRVWTMPEALSEGKLAIEELEPADLNRLRFVNHSDRLVLCLAGQVIEGGKQNRTLATDALLPLEESVVLPIYCVQKGRWTDEKGRFSQPSVGMAPMAVRNSAAAGAGQQQVWEDVNRSNEQMKVATPDKDLLAGLKDKRTQGWLERARRIVIDKLPGNCVGVVVSRGQEFVGADLFNRPELFRPMRDGLLDSYLLAIYPEQIEPLAKDGDRAAEGTIPVRPIRRPTQQECKAYLGRCYQAELAPMDSPGAGQQHRLRGGIDGTVLSYKDKMVHTHLAPRVYATHEPPPVPQPVPVPPPVPLPRPEPPHVQ